MDQTPTAQPSIPPQPSPSPVTPKSSHFVLLIAGLTLFLGGLGGGIVLSQSLLSQKPKIEPIAQIVEIPTPTQAPNLMVSWQIFIDTTDPSLGLVNYQIKIPSVWKQVEHSSGFQNTEVFQDSFTNLNFKLVIHQEKNTNIQTGKPYTLLKELTGFPYDVPSLLVDGQQSAQVLPRAGSESDYKVLFFSKDMKFILSIELDTPRDGSRIKEGNILFDQILSTFKFL